MSQVQDSRNCMWFVRTNCNWFVRTWRSGPVANRDWIPYSDVESDSDHDVRLSPSRLSPSIYSHACI